MIKIASPSTQAGVGNSGSRTRPKPCIKYQLPHIGVVADEHALARTRPVPLMATSTSSTARFTLRFRVACFLVYTSREAHHKPSDGVLEANWDYLGGGRGRFYRFKILPHAMAASKMSSCRLVVSQLLQLLLYGYFPEGLRQ